ncbi:MAG: dihydroorotase [Kiritimatiellaeota bacterium]|nr:dihydroorotase [Kiritimatiellota bacterium]
MTAGIYIRGGRLVDPATGRDEVADLYLRDGRIAARPAGPPPEAACVDARGLVVAPGLIDLHVHLREPGGEEAETIETGARAAARGGFTTIVAMPNTKPALDTPELMSFVQRRGADVGLVRVLPAACITADRQGERLSDFAALVAAGAAAFTDDGSVVANAALLQQALREARRLGRPVLEHAEDHRMEKVGVMHEGEFSKHWKLPGIPAAAEARIVARDIALAAATGAAVHIQHVSAAESVRLIRAARARGVRVTGELTPHHLALTDADVRPDDANFKMNPPLRSAADRAALSEGLADGTLTCLATDHAPHTAAAKARGFRHAPSGVVGLETAVGVTYTELVCAGRLDLLTWLRRWTTGPAEVLGLPPPSLAEGAAADLVLLDLAAAWTVQPEEFVSKSRNTPFGGQRLTGRAAGTVLGGAVIRLDEPRWMKNP